VWLLLKTILFFLKFQFFNDNSSFRLVIPAFSAFGRKLLGRLAHSFHSILPKAGKAWFLRKSLTSGRNYYFSLEFPAFQWQFQLLRSNTSFSSCLVGNYWAGCLIASIGSSQNVENLKFLSKNLNFNWKTGIAKEKFDFC